VPVGKLELLNGKNVPDRHQKAGGFARFPFRSNGFDHELIKRRKHGD
jgi:hypothetical protein